jgi:hypothetical protein
MSTPLRCAACGHTGFDVGSRIVEVTPEREVVIWTDVPPVPERFRVEARCTDKYECQDRQAAKESA